jgi:enamine deaminase RidA (YjgF/YER057c/UK114 family)
MTKETKSTHVNGQVKYLNPDDLPKNPAFTNVVTVTGPVKTVYVGGQDAVDASGAIVGKGDIQAQTEQILKNIQAALAAGGAQLEHIIKWNIYVVQGQSLQAGFEAFQRVWGNRPNPPAVSFMFVAGLAHPDFLAEIDAVAVVPE